MLGPEGDRVLRGRRAVRQPGGRPHLVVPPRQAGARAAWLLALWALHACGQRSSLGRCAGCCMLPVPHCLGPAGKHAAACAWCPADAPPSRFPPSRPSCPHPPGCPGHRPRPRVPALPRHPALWCALRCAVSCVRLRPARCAALELPAGRLQATRRATGTRLCPARGCAPLRPAVTVRSTVVGPPCRPQEPQHPAGQVGGLLVDGCGLGQRLTSRVEGTGLQILHELRSSCCDPWPALAHCARSGGSAQPVHLAVTPPGWRGLHPILPAGAAPPRLRTWGWPR